jgi:hypothetical protein
MFSLAAYFRRRSERPYVRPWALATPVAVLLVCLPLLRPLRHPGQAGVDEVLRLATISALVEHRGSIDATLSRRLAIDPKFKQYPHVIAVGNQIYSDQPPMLAFLLSAPYWLMHARGYRLGEYSVLVPYLLTLIGVTLPTAGSAGLIYRMARIFELHRTLRAGLAAVVVFGTGLISYSVVLNSHVPAAFLVLACAGCLVHLSASARPQRGGGWLVLAGFCAALAATIDLAAAAFLVPMFLAVWTMRLRPALRVGGMILFALGTLPPILLHASLLSHLTGDLLPGSMHPELALHLPPAYSADDSTDSGSSEEDTTEAGGFWPAVGRATGRIFSALTGDHGLLVHFPVAIVGFAGMFAVMHRHWPGTIKLLAAISAIAMLAALLAFAGSRTLAANAGFGNRWLIVFLPILLFWAGAWLRRKHHPAVWAVAGALLAFSVMVSLIGATDPMPAAGYDRYTVAGALHNLFYPASPNSPTALAGG